MLRLLRPHVFSLLWALQLGIMARYVPRPVQSTRIFDEACDSRSDRRPSWVVRVCATTSDSAEDLLDGVRSTLVRGEVPLWRVSVAIPTLGLQFRGATLHWRRDRGIQLEAAPHGAETDELF